MKSLEYENQIFLDGFHEDALSILAKGLGVDRIFLNFLKVYCDSGNLVLVLNTSQSEEEYFLEHLDQDNVKPLPRIITNEINASERQNVYLQGGVLFITSRILVVDLLTDRVPIEHVTGILVYKAHRIIESCQEAFILRLFRQKNKTGFIKAFSDSPAAFTSGFAHVERTMKNLFVRKLFLWPRFHANVVSSLEQHKVDVVEVHVQITSAMLACQTSLLDLINACIKELQRCTTAVDTEEITVENAISRHFDTMIRQQLDPVWHQLSAKTRQLVSDLKTLRLILRHLTQYDCVTFYSMVTSVRTNEKTFGQNTGWLFLQAADSLFMHAKERVYGKAGKKDKDDKKTEDRTEDLTLEVCPKWKILSEILQEIDENNKKNNEEPGRVLIAAEDDRTCSQLREYLCDGGRNTMVRLYNKFVAVKGHHIQYPVTKKAKTDKSSKTMDNNAKVKSKDTELTLTQMVGNGDVANQDEQTTSTESSPYSSQDAYYGMIDEPVTIIHPLHGGNDPLGLTKTLQEVQPKYVILYDADIQFVRELEVFRASHPGEPLRVYFLMYTGSVEEQRYLTTLRKEKEAFEYLIREKASMVIPEDQDGKLLEDPKLSRDLTPANATVNTRKGGAAIQHEPGKQLVVVDMREFRSELPSLIHRRGIDIEPVTIEVGDYILTPDICVERKSVSDLIGSLNNGRLFNQCVSMCRHYKRPVLLIEFDANKSFSLQQGKYQMSSDVSLNDVSSRLGLLTLHFPKLRILWCQSPYATAELFEELKMNRPQPNVAAAMAVGTNEDGTEWTDKYSHGPQDLLLKMPGVNVKNYRIIMNKVHNLQELCSLSEERLTEIMGNSVSAKTLHTFLHSEHKKAESMDKGSAKTDYKRGFKRSRR